MYLTTCFIGSSALSTRPSALYVSLILRPTGSVIVVELPSFVVGERRCVAVAVGHAFQAPAATSEFVFDLAGKGQRIASAFCATESILRPLWRFE